MARLTFLLASLLLALTLGIATPDNNALFQSPKATPRWEWLHARFSPKGGCTDQIVTAINNSRSTCWMIAYNFTSDEIAQALIRAHARKVDVGVIVDKSCPTERGTVVPALLDAGIPLWVDHAHAITHDKYIVIDNEVVLTGSFNYTKSAEESNAENIVPVFNFISDYKADFFRHVSHAKFMQGKS
jgi:phosphatidylserine/phosphatidylglycerophosphate/cardiolipin synthase-like enzyme